MMNYDYDYIIIGSGFGGSVSAMRLTQKGYKVAVIESGKRYRSRDFAKTNWNIRKFLWMPKIFCYGIQRFTLLRDVLILGGAGVGGGSLVYANTLYVPPDKFFNNPEIKNIGGKNRLLPFYNLAQKMLGVVENKRTFKSDEHVRAVAAEYGKEDTFVKTPVGVYFGRENEVSKDPYFMGEGPERRGCNFCGGCMIGCRYESKNTLDKNYLYFAEKFGAGVISESKVIDLLPLGNDGSEGYELTTARTTGLFGIPHRKYRARHVVLSAGVIGTLSLLFKMKQKGRMKNLSERLGSLVRTNSEALLGVRTHDKDADFSKGLAITSSVHPDEDTHIEPVRYPSGSDVMGLLPTVLTDGGGRIPRQLRYVGNLIKHPLRAIRMHNPFGFAKKTIILLVMQTLDNSIKVVRKRRLLWPFTKTLTSTHGKGEGDKVPSYIPLANDFARRLARRIKGTPGSTLNEVLLDIPTTAHILGGCAMGRSAEEGVIDEKNRVFGYENLIVCDGSMIPANLGVNPSLSITALTERAMSFIPPKDKKFSHLKVETAWRVKGIINPHGAESTKKKTSKKPVTRPQKTGRRKTGATAEKKTAEKTATSKAKKTSNRKKSSPGRKSRAGGRKA